MRYEIPNDIRMFVEDIFKKCPWSRWEKVNGRIVKQLAHNAPPPIGANKASHPSRITSKGHGKENPIADNSTEKGRSMNRRAEFTITRQ